jgi:hypothetical protein
MTTHAKEDLFTDAQDRMGGMVTFAGIMLLVAGAWHTLAGIAALFNDKVYFTTPDYVYSLDLTGWGWGHLTLGLIVIATGGAILSGQTWGRVAGVVLVVLSLIANFMFIPWYPVWALVIIAIDITVIWALVAWRR